MNIFYHFSLLKEKSECQDTDGETETEKEVNNNKTHLNTGMLA